MNEINNSKKLYSKAKKYIAGGNMLFSKRPDVFLPGKWPSYFTQAKGCEIQALDGKKYIDVCIMYLVSFLCLTVR